MPKFAPEAPTTHELKQKYRHTPEQRQRILEMRERVSCMLGEHSSGLLVVIGPCGMTEEAERIMAREAGRLARLTTADPANLMLYRTPDWKPRTREEDWHGLITSNPDAAYRILSHTAGHHANVAIEISTDPHHLERNAELTTLAWKGGRNNAEPELTERLALYDPTIPVAVKNGLDGEVESALEDVAQIEELRQGLGARAILLWRGGLNAQTPETWGEQYLRIHELTDGRFIVDVAHGGEQALDPNHEFGKSVEGQEGCMDHLIRIVQETGKAPVGIFAEASDHKGLTDPNMPFDGALSRARHLAKLKQSLSERELTRI